MDDCEGRKVAKLVADMRAALYEERLALGLAEDGRLTPKMRRLNRLLARADKYLNERVRAAIVRSLQRTNDV